MVTQAWCRTAARSRARFQSLEVGLLGNLNMNVRLTQAPGVVLATLFVVLVVLKLLQVKKWSLASRVSSHELTRPWRRLTMAFERWAATVRSILALQFHLTRPSMWRRLTLSQRRLLLILLERPILLMLSTDVVAAYHSAGQHGHIPQLLLRCMTGMVVGPHHIL